MNSKIQYGQFYSTNAELLIGNLIDELPNKEIDILEPFCGKNDLLDYLKNHGYHSVQGYDIVQKKKDTIQRDTLRKPLDYRGKWEITNPPYLARCRSEDKTIFQKYDTDDLYKLLLCLF